MKQRVAVIATCLNLILCVAFLFLCAGFARNSMNENALGELSRICRLSSINEASAAFDEEGTIAHLRDVVSGSKFVFALYDAQGQMVFSSRTGMNDALSPEELAGIQADTTFSGQRTMQLMEQPWLFSFVQLSGDRILGVARPAIGLVEALDGKLLLLILIAMLVAGVSLLILQIAINRTNRFVGEVQRVLEDFSEGQFDSRIQGVQGDSLAQAAHFNEVMGRVQDRIFRQKTRNQALSTVINHMQNGILAVDDQLNVILVTPSAKHLLNIVGSPEGMPINQASKDVKMDKVLMDAMQQEGVYTNEVAARTAVGRGHTPLRLYVSPMLKDGQAVGAVALVEDITELRRLEQVRTDFAANVSHELKTPLTSIKGFVETLQNGAINNPEMANKFLRIIMLEADRLTRLINDILSISKLESGKDEVMRECIRLDEMTEDIADMLSIQAAEKNVTIHARINEEPSYVMGNPDRVEQMLINLIENAVKYNKENGQVNVSVYNSGDMVNVSISDTGIGIPDESINRLFERFYRVDKGRSRSMGGTGLGLAIVKHIIKSMGGMIEVHSKYEEGTEFLITLPRADAERDINRFEDGSEEHDLPEEHEEWRPDTTE